MKVLRSVLVAFSFGLMISCSNSAGSAENGGQGSEVKSSNPIDQALDKFEAMVVKIEKAATLDEIKDMKDDYRALRDEARAAMEAELAAGKTEADFKSQIERAERLEKRYREAKKKFRD